jgi:hypothetical protein
MMDNIRQYWKDEERRKKESMKEGRRDERNAGGMKGKKEG